MDLMTAITASLLMAFRTSRRPADQPDADLSKKEKVLLELLTNEGSAPSSTSQFDLVINNVSRLRGR